MSPVYVENPADYIGPEFRAFRALPRHERLGERGIPVAVVPSTAAYLYVGKHRAVTR